MQTSFLVRWTKEDLRADVPSRLKKALGVTGSKRAPVTRSLLIRWMEDIEDRGPVQVRDAVARVNDRAPTYGSRPGGSESYMPLAAAKRKASKK